MLKIFGYSDDLIEIEGELSEEFSADQGYLAFSDGTVLRIDYDDEGMWRINRVQKGFATYTKTEALDTDENYSDVVELHLAQNSIGIVPRQFSWVMLGSELYNKYKSVS